MTSLRVGQMVMGAEPIECLDQQAECVHSCIEHTVSGCENFDSESYLFFVE